MSSRSTAGLGASRRGDGTAAFRTILGVDFFQGSASQAVQAMSAGGLLVIPAAPALKELQRDALYRTALLAADVVLADSGFMVLVWNWLRRDNISRLSGLTYLRELLLDAGFRRSGNTLWVMASESAAARNRVWLRSQGVIVPEELVYVAPMYEGSAIDAELLDRVERLRPEHVVITVGGGTQERLGLYLKEQLGYRPSIHCVGAAIAFLSGVQVRIPRWADRLYLGWLFRSLSEPMQYLPRYWGARKLLAMLRRYQDRLPVQGSGD